MKRVVEQEVVWRHRHTGKVATIRYYTATDPRYTHLSDAHTTRLQQDEIDAIEAYERACEDGAAQILARPTRRKVE